MEYSNYYIGYAIGQLDFLEKIATGEGFVDEPDIMHLLEKFVVSNKTVEWLKAGFIDGYNNAQMDCFEGADLVDILRADKAEETGAAYYEYLRRENKLILTKR